ncbi:hypothetical protein D929_02217, partial [Enterococcus faecalis 02-MB-P-10]|uniref:hypothetical protein n=1 Tax=Enterococcus faecalis TaxID=1351 RepID=UPI000353BC58
QAPVEEMTSISKADKDAFLSLFQKGLPKNKKPPALKAKKKTSDTERKSKKTPSILRLPPFLRDKQVMVLIGLVLLLVGVVVVVVPLLRQENQGESEEQRSIQSLKKEVNELHAQLEAQDKLHTFNRFFLTNYYSGTNAIEKAKQKVKPFVSPEVEKKFSSSGSQVKSISPWTLKKTKSGWEATYVVSVQTKEKVVETNRVQFTVQEKEKNYQVTTLPKEEPFDLTKKTNE